LRTRPRRHAGRAGDSGGGGGRGAEHGAPPRNSERTHRRSLPPDPLPGAAAAYRAAGVPPAARSTLWLPAIHGADGIGGPGVAIAAALALSVAGPSRTAGLEPVRGRTIDLGALSGVAYYTVERDGFHVGATLARRDAAPVRLEAVLAPGQGVVLSAPREAGAPSDVLEISRRSGTLLVRKAETPLTN
jgi:hypothetical protein